MNGYNVNLHIDTDAVAVETETWVEKMDTFLAFMTHLYPEQPLKVKYNGGTSVDVFIGEGAR